MRSKNGSRTNGNGGKRRFHNNNNKNNNNNGQRRGGFKPSTLDPALLIKKATNEVVEPFLSERTIAELPLDNRLIQCLTKKGFERPTEIQDRTLEPLLKGRDLLGIANTGTGKTGAFMFPIIEELIKSKQRSFALVVVPTRELATQVNDEFRSMSNGLGLFNACFIGGTNINRDLYELRRESHVIIGTPGRLLDLMERGALKLGKFQTLVLDEFDRMLDMGFIKDVQRIIDAMKSREHTMLFSATLDEKQRSLINGILQDPVTVQVSDGKSTADHIEQDIIRVPNGMDKFNILMDMLEGQGLEKVLLFEETKHKVKRLARKLQQAGIRSGEIHGNKTQSARQTALNDFKKGRIRVLVATDVAARGLDVSDVTHVINYQVPQSFDSYIHRIGRTGRAGKAGQAYTFVG